VAALFGFTGISASADIGAHPVLYLCGDFLDLLELGLRLFEGNALTIF
jgi:hypothetical protein